VSSNMEEWRTDSDLRILRPSWLPRSVDSTRGRAVSTVRRLRTLSGRCKARHRYVSLAERPTSGPVDPAPRLRTNVSGRR
jgi:hypothetical protein